MRRTPTPLAATSGKIPLGVAPLPDPADVAHLAALCLAAVAPRPRRPGPPPALARGATVISDRFADSTRVYQGVARAGLRPMVDALHTLAIGLDPDLTLVLDLDPEAALARGLARGGREDRFERLGPGFQARLRQGFLALAAEFPARCRVIPATGDPATVAARIAAAIDP